MKIAHLSDLHLGKRINEFSMMEDQRFILEQCLNIIDNEKPDAVVLAGDIYDKSVPPADAVTLFDDFLYNLEQRRLQVFVISGNHDSPERIAFASRLLDSKGIHLSPVYDGSVETITLRDSHGAVHFWMLPFIKPLHVRRFFPEEKIESYTDAMQVAISAMHINAEERNVLVTHQFVTGAERSESEETSVGGADNVDSAVFADFDYVALGHIHGPQNIDTERIRYCGTPLKYSFSEAEHEKSITIVELEEKGSLAVHTVPLVPLHDLREVRGTYMELMKKDNYSGTKTDDYLHITLTDEEDIPEVMNRLRIIYPNLMKVDYDNRRTRHQAVIDGAKAVEKKTPMELFDELYEKQNGAPLSEEQREYAMTLMENIWEDRT